MSRYARRASRRHHSGQGVSWEIGVCPKGCTPDVQRLGIGPPIRLGPATARLLPRAPLTIPEKGDQPCPKSARIQCPRNAGASQTANSSTRRVPHVWAHDHPYDDIQSIPRVEGTRVIKIAFIKGDGKTVHVVIPADEILRRW